MNNVSTLRLGPAKKAGAAISGMVAAAIPAILGLTNAPALRAQSTQEFEVASIRRVEIPNTDRGVPVFPTTGGVGTSDPSRITYRATWLIPLIADAFGVRSDQVSGPAWLRTERYDIVAKIPDGATKDQFKVMLGNLLVDRFRLRFHIGANIRPIYALRVGKNGPRVQPAERRADDGTDSSRRIGAPDEQGCPTVPPSYQGMVGWPMPGAQCWVGRDVPIADLARFIEQPAGRPITDETGLTGRYDFKIRFQSLRRDPETGAPSDPVPTIFTAVEEQLGLKLESSSSSFPQLIIDSIQREPTEN